MSAATTGRGRALRRRDAAFVRDTSFGPSMTPMVDVVLVILIFFMASTTFIGPEWLLRSALPTEGTGQSESAAFSLPPARFDIELSTDTFGRTLVGGMGLERASLEECEARIRQYADRLGADRLAVSIVPSAEVAYRDVVRLHEVCAEVGIQQVGLK